MPRGLPMTFSQLLLILRARRAIILVTLFATVTCAVAASFLLPRTYHATTTLVLNYKGIDPLTGVAFPGQMVPSYVATQVGIIKSTSVARQVAESLRLAERSDFREKYLAATRGRGAIDDWIAEQLLKRLDVVPARDSNVLQVAASAQEAELAAAIANAFATAYQTTSVQLKVEPVRNASLYFNDQIKSLRAELAAAQERLSSFQQENGLVSAEARHDMETLRLNELSAQLVTVQNQLMEANARRRVSRAAGGSESPDVLASPLIQNLRAAVAQAEARFSLLSERYTEEHPHYREAAAELARLRAELAASMRAASGSIASSARMLQQREAELTRSLAEQKTRVLALNRARDQLAVLTKDVESAQHAYDAATQRVAQTNLEASFNQSEAAILNAAPVPYRHSSPRLSLNLVAGMLAGMLLGVGLALVAEARDRRVRTAHDLADALQAPVFGAVDWNTRPSRHASLPHWLRPRSLPSPQAS
jgi:succinoglycan biosynthesis transport protein ExoP